LEPELNYDDDLELLETHLDGALPPADAEALGRRLAADPGLFAELERLRSQRAARQAAWSSMEPSPAESEALVSSSIAAAVREERWATGARFARRATVAAAVLLFAFAGGWMARGRAGRPAAPAVQPASTGGDRGFVSSGGGDGRPFPASPGSAPTSQPASPGR
jgi:anti-sigma factor RsiW